MEHIILKQPNSNKLSVYSTITDALIIIDATKEELLELYTAKSKEDAIKRWSEHIDNVLNQTHIETLKEWSEVICMMREEICEMKESDKYKVLIKSIYRELA